MGNRFTDYSPSNEQLLRFESKFAESFTLYACFPNTATVLELLKLVLHTYDTIQPSGLQLLCSIVMALSFHPHSSFGDGCLFPFHVE